MTNQNTTTTTVENQNNDYFNTLLMARAIINEVKVIKPTKGNNYCVVNASILEKDGENISYTPINLIARGEQVKELLWKLKDTWPTRDNSNKWIADIISVLFGMNTLPNETVTMVQP